MMERNLRDEAEAMAKSAVAMVADAASEQIFRLQQELKDARECVGELENHNTELIEAHHKMFDETASIRSSTIEECAKMVEAKIARHNETPGFGEPYTYEELIGALSVAADNIRALSQQMSSNKPTAEDSNGE